MLFIKVSVFSISKSIEENRSNYYKELQLAQQKLEITKWIEWFASIIIFAQDDAEKTIQFTIKKMKFFVSNDVPVTHAYFDKEGKQIAIITIKPTDCASSVPDLFIY